MRQQKSTKRKADGGPCPAEATTTVAADHEPVWLSGVGESVVDKALAFRRLASVGPGADAGAWGPTGGLSAPSAIPHVAFRVLPAVSVCLVAPASRAPAPDQCQCGCRAWWADTHCRDGFAFGAALSEAALGTVVGADECVLLLLWPPPVQCDVSLSLADVVAGVVAAARWSEIVVLGHVAGDLRRLGDGVRWTARSPELVCAALWCQGHGRRGVLVGTGCAGSVLCDAEWWDGPGLDPRVKPCLFHADADLTPEQRCGVWARAWSSMPPLPVRPPPGTASACPAFVARSLLQLQKGGCGTGPGRGPQHPYPCRFPCLCGAPRGAVTAVAHAEQADDALLMALDTAAHAAAVRELLVVTAPLPLTASWLGPYRTGMLLTTGSVCDSDWPCVEWRAEPCQRCAHQHGEWRFLAGLEEALDAAPFTPGQDLSTRLPLNCLVAGWLRFGAAVQTLGCRRVRLDEVDGADEVDVWRVLIEDADGTRAPTRMVLVDARTKTASSAVWQQIKRRVVDTSAPLTGILWHGDVVQDGLLCASTLRVSF